MADGKITLETGIDNSGAEKGIKQTEQSIKSHVASIAAEYRKMGMSQSEAMKKAWSEVDRASKGSASSVKSTAKSIKDSTDSASDSLNKLSDIAKKGLDVGVKAVAAAGTGLAALAGYSVKVGAAFEEGMSKVAALSGASGDELEALTDKAEEMGAKTKFSAAESAEAMEYMAQAGWKTEDMLNGIEGIMNLAAASGEDLAMTSDIVTDALTAFGLSAKDSTHFADVLARAAADSNTNVAMMGDTFKYVAPVAGAMGFSIEDTAVAIGLMANSGIKASQAGTALRAVFTRLAKPPKEAANAMKALNLQVTKSDGSFKSLSEIMSELRKKFSGLTAEQKTQYAAMLGGQEAMSGLLAIVNAGQADFDKLTESIANADGTALAMAETMQDNLAGQFEIFMSSLEGLGLAIYDGIKEPLKNIVKYGTETLNDLTNAVKENGLSGLTEAIGEVLSELIFKISEYAPQMIDCALLLMNSFIQGIKSHLGNISKNAVNVVVTFIEGALSAIPEIVTVAFQLITNLGNALAGKIPELYSKGADAIIAIGNGISENIDSLLIAGFNIINNLVMGIANSLPELLEQGPIILSNIIAGIISAIPQLIDTACLIINTIANGISINAPSLGEVAQPIYNAILSAVQNIDWGNVALTILNAITHGWSNKILGLFGIATKSGEQLAAETAAGAIGNITSVSTAAQSVAEKFPNAVNGKLAEMSQKGFDLSQNFAQGIESGSSNTETAVNQIVQTADAGLEKNIPNISEKGARSGQYFAEGLQTSVGTVQKSAENLANAANSGLENLDSTAQSSMDNFANIIGTQSESANTQFSIGLSQMTTSAQTELGNITAAAQTFAGEFAAQGNKAASDFSSQLTSGMDGVVGKARSIGSNISQGIANGISSSSGAVSSAARSAVSAALEAAKAEAGIHSPSREGIWIGKMFDLGIAKGLEGYTDIVEKAAFAMAGTTITAAEEITEEEQEEYDKRVKQLKNALDLELITEEEYYKRFAKLNNEYFTRDSEEWQDHAFEVAKYVKEQYDSIEDAISEVYDSLVDKQKEAFEAIYDDMASFKDKLLSNMSSVFATDKLTIKSTGETIETTRFISPKEMQAKREFLQQYADDIDALMNRVEVPKSLMDQILELDPVEASKHIQTLLGMDEQALKSFFDDYAYTESFMDSISKKIYGTVEQDKIKEAESLGENIGQTLMEKLREKFPDISEDFLQVGDDAGKNFFENFQPYLSSLVEQFQARMEQAMAAFVPTVVYAGADSAAVQGTGTTSNYVTYQFNAAKQTVREQIDDARAAAALDKFRGIT